MYTTAIHRLEGIIIYPVIVIKAAYLIEWPYIYRLSWITGIATFAPNISSLSRLGLLNVGHYSSVAALYILAI